MSKVFQFIAAFAVAFGILTGASAALAEEVIVKQGECNAIFPFSLFEETSTGENCPPNQAEKVTGDLIVIAVGAAIVADVTGAAEVFPLNEGVLWRASDDRCEHMIRRLPNARYLPRRHRRCP